MRRVVPTRTPDGLRPAIRPANELVPSRRRGANNLKPSWVRESTFSSPARAGRSALSGEHPASREIATNVRGLAFPGLCSSWAGREARDGAIIPRSTAQGSRNAAIHTRSTLTESGAPGLRLVVEETSLCYCQGLCDIQGVG